MRLKQVDLQELDKKAQKNKAEGLNKYENIDGVLHHQELLFVLYFF